MHTVNHAARGLVTQASAGHNGGTMAKSISGALPLPAVAQLRRLRGRLLRAYRGNQRDLPWRRTGDPYAIWVSEIMLQQTQVVTVVPRYHAFLRRFPTIAALAAEPAHAVTEAWAGLGYYRRARLLHLGAQAVMQLHGGVLPQRAAALLSLPGIGRYTAGAIASIAFGEQTPVVDGNVERVVSRLLALQAAPRSPAGKKYLWAVCSAWVSGRRPGDFNQALMELGATVCLPRAPRCQACALRPDCLAYAQGNPEAYPTPVPKAARQPLKVAFALCQDSLGTWLWRRPLMGLWAGLWEPPSACGPDADQTLAAQLKIPLDKVLTCVRHTLTHRDVTATIHWAPQARLVAREDCRPYAEPLRAPLSTLARKALVAGLAARPLGEN